MAFSTGDPRWQLYRLLSDPFRLRLLALAAEEELSVGELAELLGQTQPNVSRHAGPLRQGGLLRDRRNGTRTLLRVSPGAASDPVVADALAEGQRLCDRDGSLARVAQILRARDTRTREFFARPRGGAALDEPARELPAYLFALGAVLDAGAGHDSRAGRDARQTAVDAGTGDGAVLDALAPLFRRVVAIDRSEAQLAGARARMKSRRYENVRFVCDEVGGEAARRAVAPGADVVVAARMLHHAPVPREAVEALASLLRPGGRLLVIDYAPHDDERLRDAQADVWMGFEPSELEGFAADVGLAEARVVPIPKGCVGRGGDREIPWHALVASRVRPPRPARSGRLTAGAGTRVEDVEEEV